MQEENEEVVMMATMALVGLMASGRMYTSDVESNCSLAFDYAYAMQAEAEKRMRELEENEP
jgi:hypothetical protein